MRDPCGGRQRGNGGDECGLRRGGNADHGHCAQDRDDRGEIGPAEAGDQHRKRCRGKQDEGEAGRRAGADEQKRGGNAGEQAHEERCALLCHLSLSCFKQLEASLPQPGILAAQTPRPSRDGKWIRRENAGSGCVLLQHVRQQAEETGTLDRLGEFALLLLAHGRDAGRYDLAALGNVALQQTHVLGSRSPVRWRRRTGRSCGGDGTAGASESG
jgi:hypothetical protein